MTISAQVIADSISPAGIRLTTFQLRYPRFIHSELMTHRVFSRNASSSRAIPVERMIADLRRELAQPVFWGSNKPGMQAGAELTGEVLDQVKAWWREGAEAVIPIVEKMVAAGLHKQVANRMLEPWAHINVVVTATDYQNWWALRRHEDAQPEIKVLADAMFEERINSTPRLREPGYWHLPYVRADECLLDLELQKKISVARCARVSYLTHDGRQTTTEEDIQLYDRLVGSHPLHASPAEHQATPDLELGGAPQNHSDNWSEPELHGNFRGWIQLRKTLPGEFTPG
jgi:thymidylate synthase ThyX